MDVTRRFSDRVDDYVRYRPGYPAAVLGLLSEECGLTTRSVIADVGSGTGKLTELLLANGNTVYAVEPNKEMRLAAERLLADRPGFHSVEGRAESTTLPDASMDMITAGQSFHWFDRGKAAVEFRRILRKDGFAVLVWNEREETSSAFLRAYDSFLDAYSTDYREVSHRNATVAEGFKGFFAGPFGERIFANSQTFDFEGLLGRYLSASYALKRDHPLFPEAAEGLHAIFDSHARGGAIDMPYRTRVCFGKLGGRKSL